MSDSARHDAWSAGGSYDLYMGRWSRQIAPRFLEWLGARGGGDWLDVGCGTGAMSAEILGRCSPATLLGIDPSEGFIEQARRNVSDARAEFIVGDAQALSVEDASRDVVVSALVLNFVPDRHSAASEMRRVARRGGTVGFYVWDYPGGGVEFMRAFWTAAVDLDPKAAGLAENKRFPFCTRDGLVELTEVARIRDIEVTQIEIDTIFENFDDYWRPFTLGAGPAPGYCVGLDSQDREALRAKLQSTLDPGDGGPIRLKARAWALKGTVG